jgi:Glycosyltransferase family 87
LLLLLRDTISIVQSVRLRRTLGLAAGLLFTGGIVRYLHSAVLGAASPETWLTVSDQLRPLIEKIWHGVPLTQTIPLLASAFRYGPVLYIVAGPIVAATRSAQTIHDAVLVIGHLCFWLTLYLIDRRMLRPAHWTIRVIVVGVALNFTPALESLRCGCLDTWEMLAITAGFFLLTSTVRWVRHLSAAPVVAGILTKLMPVIPLLFVIRRRWKSALVATATTVAILAVGHVAYGPEMGFGFPGRAARVMMSFDSEWPLWWENDSPRGLAYKAFAGFALKPSAVVNGKPRYSFDSYFIKVPSGPRRIIDLAMDSAAVMLLAFAAVRLWGWRFSPGLETLRILGGFASAIVIHHLVTPYSTHQYLPATLIAFVFVLCGFLKRYVTRGEVSLALLSLILIGNIVPKTIIVWMLGLSYLNAKLHSAPQLDAGKLYTFYGLPGIGLILLAVVVLRLQRKLVVNSQQQEEVRLPDETNGVAARARLPLTGPGGAVRMPPPWLPR